MKIETTHLITLSEFVEQIKREESTFSTQNAIDIIAYNDFLNQKPTIELINSLFEKKEQKKSWFCEVSSSGVYGPEGFEMQSLHYFAHVTKQNPLRFKEYPYYEIIH